MANKPQKAILHIKAPEFFDEFYKMLRATGKVKIVGLGIFEVREIAARKGVNPKTQESLLIPKHNRIRFRPTYQLREHIQWK